MINFILAYLLVNIVITYFFMSDKDFLEHVFGVSKDDEQDQIAFTITMVLLAITLLFTALVSNALAKFIRFVFSSK